MQLKKTKSFQESKYLELAKKISITIFMISVTCSLCIILTSVAANEEVIDSNLIKRPDYVENSEKISTDVYKEGENVPYKIEFNVDPRKYTKEEVERNFELAYEYLLDNILKDNESFEKVTGNLNLIASVAEYAVEVDWYSSDYELIDYDGAVNNSKLKENDTKKCLITAKLKYGEYSCEYPIDVIVYPPNLDEKEKFVNEVNIAIEKALKDQIYEESVRIPDVIEETGLVYKIPAENHIGIIVILGIMATIAMLLGVDGKKKKEKNNREKQMKYDYSEVISKLTLLLGAGMTISRAWEKISLDYKKQIEQDTGVRHFVYEEMLATYYQIKSGAPEGRSYAEFGKNCNVKEYLKLGALLEQNLKKGTKGLAGMLETESLEAFEERKNIAKRLGEEAGTKLLLPMGIMLVIVMIIVIVPAFLSFSI